MFFRKCVGTLAAADFFVILLSRFKLKIR